MVRGCQDTESGKGYSNIRFCEMGQGCDDKGVDKHVPAPQTGQLIPFGGVVLESLFQQLDIPVLGESVGQVAILPVLACTAQQFTTLDRSQHMQLS